MCPSVNNPWLKPEKCPFLKAKLGVPDFPLKGCEEDCKFYKACIDYRNFLLEFNKSEFEVKDE